ncbi:MAG: hypothetical protein OEO21_02690 [Candidatus Krumholzibacteria bacterium]|nr:hypothetical protein [Candidatus Krumholzibacteria bacterium]
MISKRAGGADAPVKRPPDETTRLVMWTLGAVVVSLALGVGALTPLLATAPFAYAAYRRSAFDATRARALAWRWSLALLLIMLAAAAFVLDRAWESVAFGSATLSGARAWLSGDATAPWSALGMLAAAAAFAAASLVSGGILGAVVLAGVVCAAAASASAVFENGSNILQSALIALAPWQWAFLLGLWLLFAPLAAFARARVLRRPGADFAMETHRRDLLWGAGLVLAAVLLRLTLAGGWSALARAWTST